MSAQIEEVDIGVSPPALIKRTTWNFRGTTAQWEASDSGLNGDRRLIIRFQPADIEFSAVVSVEYASKNDEQANFTLDVLGFEKEGVAQNLIDALTPADIGAEPLGAASAARSQAIAEAQAKIESYFPTYHQHWWGHGKRLIGNDFFRGRTTTTRFNYFAYQSPAGDSDEVLIEFLLKAGMYRIEITGQRQSNAAIIEFFLNDVSLGQLDLYAASNAEVTSGYSVTLATAGYHRFRTKVVGKNASSSSWFAPLTCVMIFQRYT
jgi:hypothetical protein